MTTTDWDAYAGTYRQLVDESTVPPLLAGVMSAATGTMIDVGCGDGILLDLVRGSFGDSWGIQGFEISAARADIARARGHEVLVDERGDVPAAAGAFDLVTSTHVIEHAPDDAAYAAELARLVRPGGLVYVETPVKMRGAWYFRRNPEAGWVLDPTHVREYRSAGAVNAVLRSAGLEILAEDLTPVKFPLAAAELLVRRLARLPQPTGARTGLGAVGVPIPRYRQQAVLARRPS
ncbi:class I SAM-dependent methyltransferase [Actinomycetospora termitidis]|uniref:Class I SAM-dependent methyltransferase n=1 Tax=Actinomycetospora termitidis TaxID=3053470 RepID=A0ABT7M1Y6_9PSEU|nr:class I SAM-dependent methyltransferase [Actinomycetospora sp. Odt1-22]MDL5154672.1 class I SAM-dependent methyltransferase [Actinomycetospora sp. Odt1-22]